MNYNKIFSLSLGLSVLALVACSDDSETGQKVASGDAVSFSLYQNETRTVYDSDDDLQIDWLWDQDKVRVFCAKTPGLQQADYLVTQKTEGDDKDTKHIGKLKHEEGLLVWGETGDYDFYAAYPADDSRVSVDPSTGVATFTVNWNQTCTITGDADANGNYEAEPDMTNAYMVAHSKVAAYTENVDLHFDPIMTTLKVVVKGKEDQNASSITVTGISIVNSNVVSSDALEGQFQYDINQKKVVNNTESSSTKTETTFCGVSHEKTDGTTENFIELEAGQTATFTVFLPPLDINAQKQIKIRVHATGATTQQVTFGSDTQSIPASYKTKITLPYFPTESNGNNWITPLDDNIYVSQLSIPGTHDAATSTLSGYTGLVNVGMAQTLTIPEQLDLGIRVFDLRPTVERSGNIISGYSFSFGTIYHGGVDTGVGMEDVMNYFDSYLTSNPGEFVIVIMRNESKDKYPLSENGYSGNYKNLMSQFLNASQVYQNRKIAFKPDLTVGEMRGKILIISRDDLRDVVTETAYTGWTHSSESNLDAHKYTLKGKETSTDVYIQDYYDVDDTDSKLSLIKTLMEYTAAFHSDNNLVNVWAINHCSGYTGLNNYCDNAQNVNKPIYEYLTGSDKTIGSTGIVMLDYVGSRTNIYVFTSYTTYGDLLPQAIIDNNYKYRMKRKGE